MSSDHTNNSTIDKERSEILAWLSPLDPRVRHQDVQAQRVEHVGDWLLQHEQFRSWCDDTRQGESEYTTLFCNGDPGVGKTYISSLVIDTLCEQVGTRNTAVVCFYVDFAARGEQSPTIMLGSLLKQLVAGLDTVPEEVVRTFKMAIGGRAPRFSEIVGFFQTITSSQRTIICIDAIDECLEGDRLKLLGSLRVILQKSQGTRLFLTGRPHIRDEIKGEFGRAVTVVSVTTNKGDVIGYLRARLDEDPSPEAMDRSLEADIVNRVPQLLSTIFLLVSLNIDGILRETTIARRRRRLNAITDGLTLGDMYGVLLERIRAQSEVRSRLGMAVLMWVCHSERPLLMDELRHALAVEIGNTNLETFDVPTRGTLLGCCQGLITIDGKSSTARLIHPTLQEYLCARSDRFVSAHSTMAEICLTYLNCQQVKSLSADSSPALEDTPFLSYASRYWGTHAKIELSKNAKLLALRLFNQYDSHISARLLLQQVCGWDYVEHDSSSVFTGLHCASFFGIAEIVGALVGMKNCGINQRDCVGITPLVWAAMYGHHDVVKLLLEQEDVDPNISDRCYGRTALTWAIENGHAGVVKLLLGQGNVDSVIKSEPCDRVITSEPCDRIIKSEPCDRTSFLRAVEDSCEGVAGFPPVDTGGQGGQGAVECLRAGSPPPESVRLSRGQSNFRSFPTSRRPMHSPPPKGVRLSCGQSYLRSFPISRQPLHPPPAIVNNSISTELDPSGVLWARQPQVLPPFDTWNSPATAEYHGSAPPQVLPLFDPRNSQATTEQHHGFRSEFSASPSEYDLLPVGFSIDSFNLREPDTAGAWLTQNIPPSGASIMTQYSSSNASHSPFSIPQGHESNPNPKTGDLVPPLSPGQSSPRGVKRGSVADRSRPRPNQCDECGKAFGRRAALSWHVRAAHRSSAGPGCPESGCKRSRRFTRADNFKIHYMRVHGKSSEEADMFVREWRDQGKP